MRSVSPHRVVALAYPGMSPFELGVVVEVFGLPRPELDVPTWYRLDVCAVCPGSQPAVGGISIDVLHGLELLDRADTVVAPGWPVADEVPLQLPQAVQAAAARGARVVSICSGAFALAAAGLLDGRRAATHWRYADQLARAYPAVLVDREVLYVDDDLILTSAGSAAGIDLCLHLVRKDHGAVIANHVARRLVMPPHRDGGQAQYVQRPVAGDDDSRIHDVIAGLSRRSEPTGDRGRARRRGPTFGAAVHPQVPRRDPREPYDWLVGQRSRPASRCSRRGDDSVERVAKHGRLRHRGDLHAPLPAALQTSPTAYPSRLPRLTLAAHVTGL